MILVLPHLLSPSEILSTSVPPDAIAPPEGELENRYKMFSELPGELTESPASIVVTLRPSVVWDALALFNVGADTLTVTLTGGPSAYTATRALRYPEPLSPDFPNQSSVVLLDLPSIDPAIHASATLTVTLSVTQPRAVSCGLFAVGERAEIGTALFGTETSIVDYSRKDRDTFGNIALIERGYTDTVRYRFALDTDDAPAVRQLLADRRAVATVYVGAESSPATIVYGYYLDFLIPLENHNVSVADLSVESIVQDTAASLVPLPHRAVFVRVDGTACIESDLGTYAELCLVDGSAVGAKTITVLDRPLVDGETLEWETTWVSGESTLEPDIGDLATDCAQTLSLYRWPLASGAQAPALASIRARIRDQWGETVEITEAALLSLKVCANTSDSGTPGGCDFPACLASDYTAGWYNRATDAYDQSAVTGLVGQGDIRALATIYDDVYYRANNPDVVANEEDWLTPYGTLYPHYWGPGDIENRQPNAYFDPAYYKAQNPDVVAAIPEFFYNSLQHYQMFGYGEGRLPCADTSLFDIPTIPIGDFYWIAKAQAEWCSDGCCAVTWAQTWSGTNIPYVTIVGDTVTVTAQVLDSLSVLAPVSTGVLTLTATVTCDGGDPVTLDPITLTIGLFTAGWHNLATGTYTLQAEVGILGETPDRWTARINGDLTDCMPAWDWSWSGSNWPLVNATGALLSVSSVDEVGVLTATPSVDCGEGVLTLPDIYLTVTEDGVSGYEPSNPVVLYVIVCNDGREMSGDSGTLVTAGGGTAYRYRILDENGRTPNGTMPFIYVRSDGYYSGGYADNCGEPGPHPDVRFQDDCTYAEFYTVANDHPGVTIIPCRLS